MKDKILKLDELIKESKRSEYWKKRLSLSCFLKGIIPASTILPFK